MIFLLLFSHFTLVSHSNKSINIQFQSDDIREDIPYIQGNNAFPVYSTIIGIPPEGSVKISYNLISRYDTLIDVKNIKNPEFIVKISKPMFFREYRVIRLSVSPFQYSNGRLVIYKNIGIAISFSGGKGGEYIQDKGNKIFKNIAINGKYALKWGKISSKGNIQPGWDGEGVKILTGRRGIYKINYQLLKNSGFDPKNINPQYLSLFHKGKEIPIYIRGEEDGKFDAPDYILFFADTLLGDSNYIYPYDTLNTYWLKLNDNKGERIVSISSLNVEEIPDTLYTDTIRFEKDIDTLYTRKFYPYHMWYWIEDTTYSISFNLPYADTTSPLYLKWGFFDRTGKNDEISLFVNQARFNNLSLNRNDYTQLSITLPPPYARSIATGFNTVSLPDSSSYPVDLDFLEVSYQKKLISNGAYILFQGYSGIHKYKVGGFISDNIEVWRIGGYKITDFTTYQDSTGYGVIFGDSASIAPVYYIYVKGTEIPPEHLEYCTSPSFLTSNGADMIIITPKEFLNTANSYADWKTSVDSLSIQVVSVEDIMNTFNYGIFNPYAMRDFLKYAYENYTYKPLYVLLFGKGTFDYRNIMGFSENKVPVILYKVTVETRLYYGSDFYYACVSGDDEMPDLMVGRIPVIGTDGAEAAVRKIQDYTSSLHPGVWKRKIFLGAGNTYLPSAVPSSENLRNDYIPENMEIRRVYQTATDPTSATNPDTCRWKEVMNTLNDGAVLFNYIGHGGSGVLGYGRYLATNDIPRLRNYNKLTFVSAFTCYNGEIDEPNYRSISEEFVIIPEVGAIGAIAPTALTNSGNNNIFDRNLYNGIFTLGLRRLGDIITYPKMLSPGNGNDYVYNLIGDPSVKLDIPKNNIEVSVTPYASPGDTIDIQGKWYTDGTINFTILDTQDFEIASVYGNIISGNADVRIVLPDSILPGQYKIISYAFTDTTDGIGDPAYFSVEGPGIQNIILHPKNPCYYDTLNADVVICDSVSIDSAFFLYRFSSGSPFSKVSLSNVSGDTFGLSSGILIAYDNKTLEYYVDAYDSLGRRTISMKHYKRILQRPDLHMGIHYPELILNKGEPYIKFEFMNDGGETIDSALISFYYRDTTGIYTMFGMDTARNISPDSLYTIDMKCANLLSQDTIQLKVILDESLWVWETNENNNTITSYIPVNIFKLSKNQDSVSIYPYPEGYFSVEFPPQPVKEDCYFQIKEGDVISPENEPDIQSVYFNKKFRVFSLEFSDTSAVQVPYTLRFYPDTISGNIYIWKAPKWIKIPSVSDSSSVSASASDKSSPEYSLFKDTDTQKPTIKVEFIGTINDSVVLNNTLQFSVVMEDENGIDFFVDKPRFTIDGIPISDPFVDPTFKNYNLIPVKIDKNIEEGTHTIEIFVRDVNGNTQIFDKVISYSIPFELLKIGNYPNPANEYTRFVYWVTKSADEAKIEVYTTSGRKIFETNLPTDAGRNEFYWNLKDDYSRKLGNGVYVYKFTLKKGNLIKVVKKILAVLRR